MPYILADTHVLGYERILALNVSPLAKFAPLIFVHLWL